jgi:exodeoxyribonuclease VII small subunit
LSAAPQQPESAPVSFEQALAQLESIVRQLEDGELGLNEALERYEKGVRLLRQCYDLLDRAERKIELLSGIDAEGRPITTGLDDRELSLEEKAERRGRRRSTSEQNPPPAGCE